MIKQSDMMNNRRVRQKRVFGCAGWAIFMAVVMSFGLGILPQYLDSFFIFLLPIAIISMIIGSITKPPSTYRITATFIIPSVTALFIIFAFILSIFATAVSDRAGRENLDTAISDDAALK